VTRWRTKPTCGYDRPTQRSPYSTPRPEVAVQRGDMHVPGGTGNSGGGRRSVMRGIEAPPPPSLSAAAAGR